MKKRDIALAAAGGIAAALAVKFLIRPKTVAWDDIAHLVPHSDRSHFISVDGVRLHYQEFGAPTNPTLILLHGFTASLYVWRSLAPLLANDGFHVIAVDLVGFGYSDKPRWFEYSIQAQARMVSRFMNRIGIGRASIVGSSYGGAVAMTLCLDYPAFVEKLVLLDAVSNDEVLSHPLLRLGSIAGIGELIAPFLIDSRALMRYRMRGTLSPSNHHLITGARISNVLRPLSSAEGHHSVLATARGWNANRIERDAHLIDHPTLIIWGEEDTVIDVDNGRSLHNSIRNSRFVILKNCGHVPSEEKSELVSGLVAEFWAKECEEF